MALMLVAAIEVNGQVVSEFQPAIMWHGRAVSVTVSPRTAEHAIVASESGGLFKTTDHGQHWSHIDTLPMFRMRDVKYGPLLPNPLVDIVIATGPGDSHVANQGGIWLSMDAGEHWTKPTFNYKDPALELALAT